MVLADALYATPPFMDRASMLFGTQVISQLRNNQNVRFRGKLISIEQYFTQSPGVPHVIKIRGEKAVPVSVSSARLYVDAHHTKRFVMALKYEGESDYRYWSPPISRGGRWISSRAIPCGGLSRSSWRTGSRMKVGGS